jgi:DNA-binding NarL/FixJ family response regulator
MNAVLTRALGIAGRAGERSRISVREEEIAALVAGGSTNKEIAGSLGLSDRTVETHVQNLLTKLGFHSRTQIATWAMREGIAPHTIDGRRGGDT